MPSCPDDPPPDSVAPSSLDRPPDRSGPDSGSSSDARSSTDHRLVRLVGGSFFGVEGRPVEIQVNLSRRSSPGFHIVGLPGKSTQESRERIRTAIQNSGYAFPHKDRILVNLAPAFERKDGAVFDLPIALGILVTTGQVPCPGGDPSRPLPIGFLGELGLQGEVRPVPGALLVASALRQRRIRRVVVPARNAAEVATDPAITVLVAATLHDAIEALGGGLPVYTRPQHVRSPERLRALPDFAEVRGQEMTKRGILVAAAGGHNLLLAGPPGVGKTMLAQRIPGILPPLSFEEFLEVTRIYSARGTLEASPVEGERPFRAPHHTISYAGLVGGGSPPRPGEISLAHRGILFLDELPEFQRRVLETLRQPLESGRIHIARGSGAVVFPADFRIVASMNPCPCGYAGHSRVECRCPPAAIERYRQRISGPLLDRLDIFMEVDQPTPAEVLGDTPADSRGGLSTAYMRDRITATLDFQRQRWGRPILNAQVSQETLLRHGAITGGARRVLGCEAQRRALSARALGRVLRIARTLADLDRSPDVEKEYVLEALGLHRPDWTPS